MVDVITIPNKNKPLGCCLVCDSQLAIPAGSLAKRLAKIWNVDIHIFVELGDCKHRFVKQVHDPLVTYHYNKLFTEHLDILPDHPRFTRAAWGRLFAPSVLVNYDRLLYVDVDILPGPLHCDLSKIELPFGLAMVRDAGSLDAKSSVMTIPGGSNTTVDASVGRYFNSGVILFDPSKWDQLWVNKKLEEFHANGKLHSQYPDQDFINEVFSGKIAELSPNFNFQFQFMNLGLIASGQPTIRHYSGATKPFHLTNSYGTPTPILDVLEEYRDMLCEAQFNELSLNNTNKTNRFLQLKGLMRLLFDRAGIVTKKQHKLLEEWTERRSNALNYIEEGFTNGVFLDHCSLVWEYNIPASRFTGLEILPE